MLFEILLGQQGGRSGVSSVVRLMWLFFLSFKPPGPKYQDTSSSAEKVWAQKPLTMETLTTPGLSANKGATITRLARLSNCTALLVQYTALCLKISVVIHARLIALIGTACLLMGSRGQEATEKVRSHMYAKRAYISVAFSLHSRSQCPDGWQLF